MLKGTALLWPLLVLTLADRDDKRWIWEDNGRSESRHRDDRPRYEVFENQDLDFNEPPNRPFLGGGTGGGGGRPLKPLPPSERPGGIYAGANFEGGYGQQVNPGYYPEDGPGGGAGILTGPVPSWVKQEPFKNFDRCKCTERFNCPSPGISYGHCDAGKQYCCFTIDKHNHLGEPLPSKPIHSIENGILVGPGGPVDPIPGIDVNPRPPRPGGFVRPGGNYARPGGGGFGGRPSYGSGPGGPADRPYNLG